jgi:hypothetical protein
LSSSRRIRSAPQVLFAVAIVRINATVSAASLRSAPEDLLLRRQTLWWRNTRFPRHFGVGRWAGADAGRRSDATKHGSKIRRAVAHAAPGGSDR